jgi:prophage maintenance system killer protein
MLFARGGDYLNVLTQVPLLQLKLISSHAIADANVRAALC